MSLISTNLPARICWTSRAGTGRTDIERLRSLDDAAPGSNQSLGKRPPNSWCDETRGEAVDVGTRPEVPVVASRTEPIDAGGGIDPKVLAPTTKRTGR